MTAPTTSAGATLKPCPFCGGGAAPGAIRYSDHHAKSQGWDQTLFHYINCMSCGASNQGLIGKRTPEAAAAHWNRRIEFSRVEAKPTTPPDYQADVRAFHEALVPDQVADRPTMPPGKIINLRLDLIEEEFGELWAALHRGDLVAVADALADLLYVTYGTAVACGIEIAPIWREVHRSNMAKEGGPTRADGKLLKPEGWTPPDVRGELERQGWSDDGRGRCDLDRGVRAHRAPEHGPEGARHDARSDGRGGGEMSEKNVTDLSSGELPELARALEATPPTGARAMSEMTQHTPADVRERVLTVLTGIEWAAEDDYPDGRWYACCPWCGGGYPDDEETPPGRAGHEEMCELAAVLALLRTPRGEGEVWRDFLAALDDLETAANLWVEPDGPTAADVERLRQTRQRVIACARALAALRSEAPGEEDAVRRTWELAVRRAYGCLDYCGGYRGAELQAFHSGIKTVIRALEAGLDTVDTQTAALDRIGAALRSAPTGVEEGEDDDLLRELILQVCDAAVLQAGFPDEAPEPDRSITDRRREIAENVAGYALEVEPPPALVELRKRISAREGVRDDG